VQEFLFGAWSPQIIAYGQQYPWRVFVAVLVAIVLLDLMFGKERASAGGADISCSDFGDGDGGGD